MRQTQANQTQTQTQQTKQTQRAQATQTQQAQAKQARQTPRQTPVQVPVCHCGRELCIANIGLFKSLSRPLQEEIVSHALHYEVEAGETIFSYGDEADFLLIIRQGKVKLNRYDAEGKEYILDILGDGEIIGEDSFFQAGGFEFNAAALAKAKLCKVSKTALLDVVREYEDSMPLAIALIEHLSDRLHQSNERISLLMEDNAYRRIVGFLLERTERVESDVVELTLDDIAGSTNLRRETVSRKLTELQKQGLVERNGQRRLTLIDREKLRTIFRET